MSKKDEGRNLLTGCSVTVHFQSKANNEDTGAKMSKEQINKIIHEWMGMCVHERNNDILVCGSCGHRGNDKTFLDKVDTEDGRVYAECVCPECEDTDCYRNVYYPCKKCGVALDGNEEIENYIPDYCSDESPRSLLDNVVKRLKRNQIYKFRNQLHIEVSSCFDADILSANAEQIARALVEVIKETDDV